MSGLVIEGYAVVSADGMIADRNGHMPDGLKHEPDARFFREGLDGAALVHGRHSHEEQGRISDRRRASSSRTARLALPRIRAFRTPGYGIRQACPSMGR